MHIVNLNEWVRSRPRLVQRPRRTRTGTSVRSTDASAASEPVELRCCASFCARASRLYARGGKPRVFSRVRDSRAAAVTCTHHRRPPQTGVATASDARRRTRPYSGTPRSPPLHAPPHRRTPVAQNMSENAARPVVAENAAKPARAVSKGPRVGSNTKKEKK